MDRLLDRQLDQQITYKKMKWTHARPGLHRQTDRQTDGQPYTHTHTHILGRQNHIMRETDRQRDRESWLKIHGLCVYIHNRQQTDNRQTDRQQTDRQTDRQTTDRQTDRQTVSQACSSFQEAHIYTSLVRDPVLCTTTFWVTEK